MFRARSFDFSWSEFAAVLRSLDWRWLALSLILVLTTYVGRVWRWRVMLNSLAPDAGFWGMLSDTCIGFTAVVLFGRAGEPVRPYLIAKRNKVPFTSQLAVWVVERILDLLMILVIFGVALTQVDHSSIRHGPKTQAILQASGYMAGLAGAICLAALIAMRQFRGRVRERLIEALGFLPEPMLLRIQKFLAAFEGGMDSIRDRTSTLLVVFYTALEWALIAGVFECVFLAVPSTVQLGLTDFFIAVGFICLGSSLQIPGVGGGMQVATVLVLTEFFGADFATATVVATVLWAVSFFSIVPIGLGLALGSGIRLTSLRHLEEAP